MVEFTTTSLVGVLADFKFWSKARRSKPLKTVSHKEPKMQHEEKALKHNIDKEPNKKPGKRLIEILCRILLRLSPHIKTLRSHLF